MKTLRVILVPGFALRKSLGGLFLTMLKHQSRICLILLFGSLLLIPLSDASATSRLLGLGDYSSVDEPQTSSSDPFVALSCGDGHSLALRQNGSVLAWGDNEFGQANVPDDLEDVVAIATGHRHSVALKSDGTVTAWGANRQGSTVPPARLPAVALIAASGDTTVSLTRDGTLQVWGVSYLGRRTLARDLKNVRSIDVGERHVVALKLDGSVQVWGLNQFEQLNVPRELNDVIAIAAGDWHTLALKRDGSVVSWGGKPADRLQVPSNLDRVSSIAAGGGHSVVLLEDGRVVAWGRDEEGQARIPVGIEGVSSIAAGSRNTLLQLGKTPAVFGLPSQVVGHLGHQLELSVGAAGEGPFDYQWFLGGGRIEGASGATYKINSLSMDDEGIYSVLVTDRNQGLVQRHVEVTARVPLNKDAIRGRLVHWANGERIGTDLGFDRDEVSSLAFGSSLLLALTPSGSVFEVRPRSTRRVLVRGAGQVESYEPVLENAVAVSLGVSHRVGLLRSGLVRVWGQNQLGQLDVPRGLQDVVAIAAGDNHTLALRANGTVWAWGDSREGQVEVPESLEAVTQIAAGGDLSLALHEDGRVVVWGKGGDEAFQPPAGLGEVVKLAAGRYHVLALLANGKVLAWGEASRGALRVPDDLEGVMSIAASSSDSFALKVDGTLVSWGGAGRIERKAAPGHELVDVSASANEVIGVMVPETPFIREVAEVTAEPGHRVRLQVAAQGAGLQYRWERNGESIPGATSSRLEIASASEEDEGVYSVVVTDRQGAEARGQTELHLVESFPRPSELEGEPVRHGSIWVWGASLREAHSVPPGLNDVVAVSTKSDKTLALRRDGNVVVWGGSQRDRELPPGVENVIAVAAGRGHSMVLRRDGSILAWGLNTFQQSVVPDGLPRAIGIAAGDSHSVALLEDGTVSVWGSGLRGQKDLPQGLSDVVAVEAGGNHTLALRRDGTVVAWGDDRSGQSTVPPGLRGVIALAADEHHSLALKSDGTLVGWGADGFSQRVADADLSNVVQMSLSHGRVLLAFADGDARFLGLGTPDELAIPPLLHGVIAVSLAERYAVALVAPESPIVRSARLDHTVGVGHRVRFSVDVAGLAPLQYDWFHNGNWVPHARGATWDLTAVDRVHSGAVSVRIQGGSGSAATARGELKVLPFERIDSTPPGRLLTVGRINAHGEAVLGSRSDLIGLAAGRDQVILLDTNGRIDSTDPGARGVPEDLKDLEGVVSVASGGYHNLALKRDGTVVAWGGNTYGQATVPEDLFGVLAIAAGFEHSVALKVDGTLVGWGNGFHGRLNFPESWNDIVGIAAGGEFTLALRADGSVLGRGNSADGQLAIPRDLDDVVEIAAGGRHALALKRDGELVGWGRDSAGQATVPQGLVDVVSIAAGENHSVVLLENGEIRSWGSNRFGQQNLPPEMRKAVALSAGFGYTAVLLEDGDQGAETLDTRVVRVELGFPERGILLFLGDGNGNLNLVRELGDWRLETSSLLGFPEVWRPIPFEIDPAIGALIVRPDGSLPQQFFRIRRE